MATEAWIESACKTDEELARRGIGSHLAAGRHVVGEVEEEVDPVLQGRGSRWLRRNRPDRWELLLDALGLPEGGPLTPWPADEDHEWMAVCGREARVDQVAVEAVYQAEREAAAVSEPEPAPVRARTRRDGIRIRPRLDWTWQDDGICKDDGLLFFAPDGERQAEKEMREELAKELCSWCPVQTECLSHALSTPEREGVWGGLNEAERAAERRRLQRRGLLDQAGVLKQCSGCDKVKLVTDFGSDKHAKDGLNRHCRRCVNDAYHRRKAQKAVA